MQGYGGIFEGLFVIGMYVPDLLFGVIRSSEKNKTFVNSYNSPRKSYD